MKTAVDTNVLSAIWGREPGSAELVRLLGEARRMGAVVICGVVLAETLANPQVKEEFIRAFLDDTGIRLDACTDEALWLEAGRRYARQVQRRKRLPKEPVKRVLADFIVGAHAMLRTDRLITLDQRRYRTDFPELQLL